MNPAMGRGRHGPVSYWVPQGVDPASAPQHNPLE